MKHIFTLCIVVMAALSAPSPVHAQKGWEKPRDPEYKGAVYIKTAAFSLNSDDFIHFLPLAIEYDRLFSRKFSVVGGLFLGVSPRWYDCSDGECEGNTNFGFNAKIAFTQPLVRQRLFLRAEGGFSGIFRGGDRWNWEYRNRFVPAMVLELYLMVRLNNGTELMFSPLVFYPSMVKQGLGFGNYYDEMNFIPFSVGFRF